MTPRDQAMKRATRALIEAVGGIEAAAVLCRVGKTKLAEYASVNHPEAWMPADVVRDLMAVTRGCAGRHALLAMLAADAGAALVMLPDHALAPTDLIEVIPALAKESADVVSRLVDAAAGRGNARALIKDIDEAVAVLVTLRAAVVEGEG
ncbi:hypothetical protein [Sandarakinorhabdus sp.]|uniref:hypothetical protein n=1 Tax=Sandarakinorhabdus sp. TaxID=1916663 RepID=UPI00286DEA26|nr:hypothetical protein [Sandarakinorhabdus sp.]